MVDINDAFPSKYLKASDLQGKTPTVTISHVSIEEVGKDRDQRPCIYFAGKEKGIVLNKTNATNISAAYGSNTDGWTGRQVVLFTTWVDFQGQSVEAIRIRPGQAQQQAAQPVTQQAQPAPQQRQPPEPPPHQHAPQFDNGFTSDDIPF